MMRHAAALLVLALSLPARATECPPLEQAGAQLSQPEQGQVETILRCFSEVKEDGARLITARALMAKAKLLRQAPATHKDALAVYDELLSRFNTEREGEIAAELLLAMQGRAELLGELGQWPAQLAQYDHTIAFISARPSKEQNATLIAETEVLRGIVLIRLARHAEAILAFNSVITRLDGANTLPQQIPLARGMLQKGLALQGLKRNREAHDAYQALVSRFDKSTDPGLELRVLMARNNQAVIFRSDNKPREADRLYAELVNRYGASTALDVQEMAAFAYDQWIRLLYAQRQPDKAVATMTRLFEFGRGSASPKVRAAAAEALIGRAEAMERARNIGAAMADFTTVIDSFSKDDALASARISAMGGKARLLGSRQQMTEAIALWSEQLKLADRTGKGKAEPVLNGLRNKALALEQMGLNDVADSVYGDLIGRIPDNATASEQRLALNALSRRAALAPALGRFDDEIALYDTIIRRFGGSSDEHSRYGVAQALLNRGALMARAGRMVDALNSFVTVEEMFGKDTNPGMRDNLAPALINRGKALLRLGRKAEAATILDRFLKEYGNVRQFSETARDARQLRREAANPER